MRTIVTLVVLVAWPLALLLGGWIEAYALVIHLMETSWTSIWDLPSLCLLLFAATAVPLCYVAFVMYLGQVASAASDGPERLRKARDGTGDYY